MNPADLIGKNGDEVVQILGTPESSERGRYWPSPDPHDYQSLARLPDGTVRRVAVFGIKPRTILYPEEYRVWSYRKDGMTWLLFLTRKGGKIRSLFCRLSGGSRDSPAGSWTVKETASYPTGAVF